MNDDELTRFRSIVARELGLAVAPSNAPRVEDLLAREPGGASAYVERLEAQGPSPEDLAAMTAALTVAETHFFRHEAQFRALIEDVLPERIRDRRESGRLSLVSAGCASGEEAYSLAMAIEESGLPPRFRATVVGLDVNASLVERARCARYGSWALRTTSDARRQRFFVARSGAFEVAPRVRAAVVFHARNLAVDQPDVWVDGTHDVVFCRNVLMYMTRDAARGLVGRIARALVPGGFVFLGHAETMRGLSDAFDVCDSQGAFYYRLRRGAPAGRMVAARTPQRAPADVGQPAAKAPAWIDAIRDSATRIEHLADRIGPMGAPLQRQPEAQGPSAGRRFDGEDRAAVLQFVRDEQFAAALALLEAAERDADRDLFRAVVLLQLGRIDEADGACRALLREGERADDVAARAHHVIGLCREARGDTAGAMASHRLAAALDPAFTMPRLQLARLARRAGDLETTRRELAAATDLLEREPEERIALFGAGFGRSGLRALCTSLATGLDADEER